MKKCSILTLLTLAFFLTFASSCSDSNNDDDIIYSDFFADFYLSVSDDNGNDLLNPQSANFILDRQQFLDAECTVYPADVDPAKDHSHLSEPPAMAINLVESGGHYALLFKDISPAWQHSVFSIPLAVNHGPIEIALDINVKIGKDQTHQMKSCSVNGSKATVLDSRTASFDYIFK